jgi:hypothetical protein
LRLKRWRWWGREEMLSVVALPVVLYRRGDTQSSSRMPAKAQRATATVLVAPTRGILTTQLTFQSESLRRELLAKHQAVLLCAARVYHIWPAGAARGATF